jgi:Ca2+-binding EF-hand superfamily protein
MSRRGQTTGKTTVTTTTKTVVKSTGGSTGAKFDTKNYETNGLTEDEVLEIREAFDLFDTDKSGEIDVAELKQALLNLGIDTKNQTLQNMLADIDKNGDANIDFDEFINMMTAKMSDKDTREDLEKVFELFLGDDNSDKIDIRHLKRVCKELNENMSDDELNEMIVRADTDRDGKVSFEEFYAIMTKKI